MLGLLQKPADVDDEAAKDDAPVSLKLDFAEKGRHPSSRSSLGLVKWLKLFDERWNTRREKFHLSSAQCGTVLKDV